MARYVVKIPLTEEIQKAHMEFYTEFYVGKRGNSILPHRKVWRVASQAFYMEYFGYIVDQIEEDEDGNDFLVFHIKTKTEAMLFKLIWM